MPNLAQKPFAESQPAPDPVIQLGEALGLRVELSPEIPQRPHLHRLQQPHFNRAYSIGREATAEEGEKPNAGGSLPALRGDVFARFIKGILHATPKEDGEAHAAFSNRTDTAPGSDGLTLVIEHDDRADQKLCEVRDAFLAPESADRLTQLKKLHQMASLAEIAFLAKAETKVLAATRATPSIYFDAGGKPVLG
ncbi:MAG: hypothetical protein JO089_02290, partial [Alphaproteobacteria bacterium]|nr:hypothetical protein [Alphaproteobacteria bacterium]